ncbi:MAG: hypothetical protein O7C75_10125, partial [Verrucomicrobia bacterium]|nr:hypothetical protein [Verrucomicrobiota bacterium]
NVGSLVSFRYVGEGKGLPKVTPFPQTLSEVGVFADLFLLKPGEDFTEFKMNSPVWLPGVKQKSWMKIPNGKKIKFSEKEEWAFPEGSIIVHHFDTIAGVRHETHVYWARGDGRFRAAAYRWNDEQSDVQLVKSSTVVQLPQNKSINWFSPGPERMVDAKLALIGFVPQFNTRQLNHGNQLLDWSQRSILNKRIDNADLATLPRLVSLDDVSASIDLKVRSYLDANCAVCHQPGGPSRGNFDLRFATDLVDQNLINAEPMAGNMDVDSARILIPGEPGKSILYLRAARSDFFRMPPVSVHGAISPVLPLMEEWIREMKGNN